MLSIDDGRVTVAITKEQVAELVRNGAFADEETLDKAVDEMFGEDIQKACDAWLLDDAKELVLKFKF
jgi:DNA-binding ferritin-like protein (Dps family)